MRVTKRFVLQVALPTTAILFLMMWVIGIFHRGVIKGASQHVQHQSVTNQATDTVTLQTVPNATEASGTVRAEELASVTSRVVATVTEIRASAGQNVKSGETLVSLDDRDLKWRVEQAQEAVRSAEATLAQAKSDYQRDKPLYEQKVITSYDFEHTETNLKTADANLRRLQQAEKEAEVNLSFVTIRCPFTGVIVDKLANLGDMASPGKPLFTIYRNGRLWLEANVPEEMLAHIRIGEQMLLHVDTRNHDMHGRVVEIVPSSDPATHTVAVRVHLDDTRDVVPGMFGRLIIPDGNESVLTVSVSSVIRVGQLTMVDVSDQGRVQRRTVQLGRLIDNRYEVYSGLSAGEKVLTNPAGSAMSGVRE